MKVWALIRKKQKTVQDIVMEFPGERPDSIEIWQEILGELCHTLQLERPSILNKHMAQLSQFGRTAFRPDDFLERIPFDLLEIEIIPEEKNKA